MGVNGGPPDDDSLGGLVVQLADDARSYAKAEIAYYREILLARLRAAKVGAIFGIGALLLAHAAIIALVVGAVLILVPHVGPGLATLIVVIVSLVLAALLGRAAVARLSRLQDPIE